MIESDLYLAGKTHNEMLKELTQQYGTAGSNKVYFELKIQTDNAKETAEKLSGMLDGANLFDSLNITIKHDASEA